MKKSRVYILKDLHSQALDDISLALGMPATTNLGMYLGMPTLTSRVTKDTFIHLYENISLWLGELRRQNHCSLL